MDAEEAGGFRSEVLDRNDGQFRQIDGGSLAAVDQQPGPGFTALDLPPQLIVDPSRRAAIGEHGGVLTDDLVGGIAGDLGEGRIDIEDVGVGVGEADRDGQMVHHLGEHPGRQGFGGGLHRFRVGLGGEIAECSLIVLGHGRARRCGRLKPLENRMQVHDQCERREG